MASDFIFTLYKSPQTVFSLRELSLIFPETSYLALKSKVNYFVKSGKLKKVRRGIYVKEGYSPLELANKIYTPSYLSFETVLQNENIVFQYYETLFVASYLSRKIIVDKITLYYRQMPDFLLIDRMGIEEKSGFFIASKERAFLDAIFLYKDYYFDNLTPLNWERVFEIQSIYKNKMLEKRVSKYYKEWSKENVK